MAGADLRRDAVAAHQLAGRGDRAADDVLGADRPQHPAFLIEEATTRGDRSGGSYYVERLTADLAARARAHIDEIEALGGMAKAIELGLPKRRIEEGACSAHRLLGRADRDRRQAPAQRRARAQRSQGRRRERSRAGNFEKLKRLRAERDEAKTRAALEALTEGARGEANLALCVEAARAKATVGEISLAMEKAFGRHVAEIKSISGVYLAEFPALAPTPTRASSRWRAPSRKTTAGVRGVLVAKIGQDDDRGQKMIASGVRRSWLRGGNRPLFATAVVAALAAEKKVHIVVFRRLPRAI